MLNRAEEERRYARRGRSPDDSDNRSHNLWSPEKPYAQRGNLGKRPQLTSREVQRRARAIRRIRRCAKRTQLNKDNHPDNHSDSDSDNLSDDPDCMRRRVALFMTSGTEHRFGARILLALHKLDIESHLIVVSKTPEGPVSQDDQVYNLANIHTELESDELLFMKGRAPDALIVVPCDDRQLALIANGPMYDDATAGIVRLMFERHEKLNLELVWAGNSHIKSPEHDSVQRVMEGGRAVTSGALFSNKWLDMDDVRFVLQDVIGATASKDKPHALSGQLPGRRLKSTMPSLDRQPAERQGSQAPPSSTPTHDGSIIPRKPSFSPITPG